MSAIKVVSWNICNLGRLIKPELSSILQTRKDSIIKEIDELNPDILCVLEGPKGEGGIDTFSSEWLKGEYVPVKSPDGDYSTLGDQWTWFLVRKNIAEFSSLLPNETWDSFAGGKWKYHLWGEFEEKDHSHYRHPQVLVLDWDGVRVEFIGLHLKSKFINNGQKQWEAGGETRNGFVKEALTNRIKMATEATNVRAYIDAKFMQVEKPALFVMGDLNDGPGKEYFESNYLFFDLLSNIQGDVFFANRYLYHALFDFSERLRWSTEFDDFVTGEKNQHILLDHILFTQGLVDGSVPLKIDAHAGKVEHVVHDLINAKLKSSSKTSDHKPVSVIVKTNH